METPSILTDGKPGVGVARGARNKSLSIQISERTQSLSGEIRQLSDSVQLHAVAAQKDLGKHAEFMLRPN
jgi:hypothetical protein